MPRTRVDDSGFTVDNPWCMMNDNPWFVVYSTEMSFTLVKILRHALHVVDAVIE